MTSEKILSVVVPVYNEKGTVLTIIEKVVRLDFVKEVIVVHDGSTDGIRIKSNDFSVEPELTAKICKNKQWCIHEIPISYYGRSYAKGKKTPGDTGFPRSGRFSNSGSPTERAPLR